MNKSRLVALVFVGAVVFVVFTLTMAELVLRNLGSFTWNPDNRWNDSKFIADPVQKNPEWANSSRISWLNLPGKLEQKTGDGWSYIATHDADGSRLTSANDGISQLGGGNQIWVFGCSMTYGFAVEDAQTFCWQLQATMPEFKIKNWGVNGYGTVHSFMLFQELLKYREKPEIVVFVYGSFHDQRNTCLRPMQKIYAMWKGDNTYLNSFIRLENETLSIETQTVVYREFPLMRRSALIHLAERFYNKTLSLMNKEYDRKATQKLLLKIQEFCLDKNIALLVCGILDDADTTAMLHFCKRYGVETADISVDLNLAENKNAHDTHPGPGAHAHYANNLHTALTLKLLQK